MTREEIISTLKKDKQFLSDKFGVEQIALIGSYARSEQNEDSDIDVLVKLREPRLKALVGVFDYLEAKFSKKIDIVTEGKQLSERFWRTVKPDIIYV